MTTRTCDQCGKHLITHRADARFCDKDCNNAWHNEQRRSRRSTNKHLTPVSGTEGSRGGNVRSVSEARELQEQQKDKARWTLILREHMARTLLATGYLHADDLYELGVPPKHDAIKGSQTAAFVCRGWMTKAGERKCSHKAANGRKAKIYRLTDKGRQELQALVGDSGRSISSAAAAVSGENPGADAAPGVLTGGSAQGSAPGSSDQPLVGVSAGRPTPQGKEGLEEPQKQAGVHSGEEASPVQLPGLEDTGLDRMADAA